VFWNGVVRRLGAEVPSYVADAWVRPVVAQSCGDGLRLVCPTALHRDRIRDRFLPRIESLVASETGHPVAIELTVMDSSHETVPNIAQADPSQTASPETQPQTPAPKLRPKPRRSSQTRAPAAVQRELPYTFENFVVGPCNRLAREASVAVAAGRQLPANPFYLTSKSGLGKTHLARAIAIARRREGGRVLYTSAESFTNQFTESIRTRRMDRFKERYRQSCELLVLEDVQFLAGKKGTQRELFHTLSHLLDSGARVVLSADRLPMEIERLDERLASRMAAGLVADLEPPDALVRREILRTKAARGGVRLPPDCLELLVDVVRGSVRDLESVLVQIVTSASLLKQPIDLALTEQALQKIAGNQPSTRRLTCPQIVQVVETFHRLDTAALCSRSRRKEISEPRQLAMYLCRRYTNRPASEIARAFSRKHSSVTHAEKAVERRMLESAPLRYRVESIASRLDELERAPSRS
jgi:chromosomal replication initiator protein